MLKLLTIVPSPNNVKVRIALGYKGIPYQEIPQDPADRSACLDLSGQALTPVMEDKGVSLFDSAAILRFLHSNYPGPDLFPHDYEEMKKVERWEAFGRFGVKDSLGAIFMMALGRAEITPGNVLAARKELIAHVETLEETLVKRDWLVGSAMSAADITLASLLIYSVMGEHPALKASLFGPIMCKYFLLDAEICPKTQAWVRRVAAYDSWLADR
ncbi:MAG: glutathione S-transferase family protein [Planctomycetota bacterium]|nr:glutathione S-transferase family protein [Planctomycetota bacterium]MDA1113934.1 glutathione S-transferase family protein [Planctomycetota bacterium]